VLVEVLELAIVSVLICIVIPNIGIDVRGSTVAYPFTTAVTTYAPVGRLLESYKLIWLLVEKEYGYV
jgi:hypothetical protein